MDVSVTHADLILAEQNAYKRFETFSISLPFIGCLLYEAECPPVMGKPDRVGDTFRRWRTTIDEAATCHSSTTIGAEVHRVIEFGNAGRETFFHTPVGTYSTAHRAAGGLIVDGLLGQFNVVDLEVWRDTETRKDMQRRFNALGCGFADQRCSLRPLFHRSAGDGAAILLGFDLKSCHALLSHESRNALEWLRAQQPVNGSGERGASPIPAEHRTRAMSKCKAAKYLGRPNPDSGVKWLNKCIEDGTISCETLSAQSHVFDRRQFPDAVQGSIVPAVEVAKAAKSR